MKIGKYLINLFWAVIPAKKMRLVIAILFISSLAHAAVNSKERITLFQSKITINRDTSIDVTEKISVYANQHEIKHGIIRWLPLNYTDTDYASHHIHYTVNKILMNGQPVIYDSQSNNDKLVLRIGDGKHLLSPGTYTFEIRYHASNAINFLRDGDELYWNVTGNDWRLRIDHVNAIVQLPAGTPILRYTAYTGQTGAVGKQFTAEQQHAQLHLQTTTALNPGEGFTIALAWPKGIIQPSQSAQWISTLQNHISSIILALTLITLLYYVVIWRTIGISPLKGTIIPLFTPPLQLSASVMRYIYHRGTDTKLFTTALLELAVNQFITITNRGMLSVTKTDKDPATLAAYQKDLINNLFETAPTIAIDNVNAATLQNAQGNLFKTMQQTYKNQYFAKHLLFQLPGYLLTILVFLLSYLFANIPLLDTTIPFIIFVIWILRGSIKKIRNYFPLIKSHNLSFFALFRFIVAIIIMLILCSIIAFLMVSMGKEFTFIVSCLLILGISSILFNYLLITWTVAGRKLVDQIEGFKLFISKAERYRLNQENPTQLTPASYEKLLPYAVALDIENDWADNFNILLKEAKISPDAYVTTWYSGGRYSAINLTDFSTSIDKSLTSALLISASASSGSGSSGGGGGGGGGGGW